MNGEAQRSHSRLDALACMYGVRLSYEDIDHRIHRAPEDTVRALLRGMGVPCDSQSDIDASIYEMERERRGSALEPVYVCTQRVAGAGDGGLSVGVTSQADNARLRWSVTTEQGETTEGEAEWNALPLSAENDWDGARYQTRALRMPDDLPLGYHRLEVRIGSTSTGSRSTLIITPQMAFSPSSPRAPHTGAPLFGISLQLYGISSSAHAASFGTLSELADISRAFGELNADMLAFEPLHARFWHTPSLRSPYSPSNRLALNPLYLDFEEAARFLSLPVEASTRMHKITCAGQDRTQALIDYERVAQGKDRLGRTLFNAFRAQHLDGASRLGRSFLAHGETEAVRAHASFEALHGIMKQRGYPLDWRGWPKPFQNKGSAEVETLMLEHAVEVQYHAFLDWLTRTQMQRAQETATHSGMQLGLFRDLAVGTSPSGSECWSQRGLFMEGATVGAPPDPLGPQGQNWALASYAPHALRRQAYEPFAELIRHNMMHAGALRIDHAMGLTRLFFIPEGAEGSEGTYVDFPQDDLLGIVALESQRAKCLVVGEDLGTVPAGFRVAMQSRGLYSYKVLYFEKGDDGAFVKPCDYEKQALVNASTHDLPTLKGYLRGHDIDTRERLGIFSTGRAAQERAARLQDKTQLCKLLQEERLLSEQDSSALHDALAQGDENVSNTLETHFIEAILALTTKTQSGLAMLQLEDLVGLLEQPNLPGTLDEYPNWRLPLGMSWQEAVALAKKRFERIAVPTRRPD